MKNLRKVRGITLISLIVTIILLLILAEISIQLIGGSGELLNRASQALDANDKATATEKMELKITYLNMVSYGENTRKATLQELADGLFADKDVEYVKLKNQEVATLQPIDVTGESSFFVKLKEYSYEFEIDENLQLASVDGVKIATTNPTNDELKETMANMQKSIELLDSEITLLKEKNQALETSMNTKVTNLEDTVNEVKELSPKIFIDFDNLLTTIATQGASWEATEDCAVVARLESHNNMTNIVCVDGNNIFSFMDQKAGEWGSSSNICGVFYVKKGSVITTRENYGIYELRIYGLKN